MPSVYPITRLPAGVVGHFPHMAKRDVEVWTRFLRGHADRFEGFSYDVAIGGRIIDLPGATDADRRGWQYSTALKIDALGWRPGEAWIIEVRPEATTSALGAALCYTLVAEREAITERRLIPTIVCESIQLDVRWVCEQVGVQIFEV